MLGSTKTGKRTLRQLGLSALTLAALLTVAAPILAVFAGGSVFDDQTTPVWMLSLGMAFWSLGVGTVGFLVDWILNWRVQCVRRDRAITGLQKAIEKVQWIRRTYRQNVFLLALGFVAPFVQTLVQLVL